MWKSYLPLGILAVLIVAIMGMAAHAYPSSEAQNKSAAQAAVLAWVAEHNTSQGTHDAGNAQQPPFWREVIAWPDGVTALALIFTLICIAWQATLMRISVGNAEEASKRELRAYLTVIIGAAQPQIRRPDAEGGDLRFETRPIVKNTGHTPAKNIRCLARAAILPVPLPRTKHLPEEGDADREGNFIGAHQDAHLCAIVDGFCRDEDVARIKMGFGAEGALYVWGLVTYDDVFGDKHYTRFCQQIYWDLKDTVFGTYISGRNETD